MLKRPDILMIGSAERNVGKTLLACELIRKHSGGPAPIAVKVTTVRDEAGPCPHGNDGCGICADFKGNYSLTLESGGPPGKDTTRLIAAGASKVFWLRVRETHMAEGLEALLKALPVGHAVIMESNSARIALEPSVFLVLRNASGDTMKESCRKVIGNADRILTFDGTTWDLATERISFSAGRWRIRQDAAAIVLAGGRSLRMGRDKNFLPVNGRPMIQHIVEQLLPLFDDVLIGANDAEKFAFLRRRVIPDRQPGMGPLMGIMSCLAESRHELNFITACDVPALDTHFIMQLMQAAGDADITVPLSHDGRPEPLLAVYRKSVAEAAGLVLGRGDRRITDLFDMVRVKFVTMADAGWYNNVNTMAEYQSIVAARAEGGDPCRESHQ